MDHPAGAADTEVGYENTADESWAQLALDQHRRGRLRVLAFDTEGVVSAQTSTNSGILHITIADTHEPVAIPLTAITNRAITPTCP